MTNKEEKNFNSILDGKIKISLGIFKTSKKNRKGEEEKKDNNDDDNNNDNDNNNNNNDNDDNKYNYLKNIFSDEIVFGNKKSIDKIKDKNYFSIIIGKNGVGKSSFVEYLINYFNKLENSNEQLMYISFSVFDNLTDKSNNKYIYNGPHNKAHATMKRVIFNNNKLKILNLLKTRKVNDFLEFINYIYLTKLLKKETKIEFIFNFIPMFNIDIFKRGLKFNNFEKIRKSIILDKKNNKLHQNDLFTGNNLSDFDIILMYILSLFIKEINNIKGVKVDYKYMQETYNKILKNTEIEIYKAIKDSIKNLDLNIKEVLNLKKITKETKKIKNAYEKEKKELNNFNLKETNFENFISLLNKIRDENSMGQAIDINFGYKLLKSEENKISIYFNYDDSINLETNFLSNSSSGQLILLYSILHLSDFQEYKGKKIIIIDEPEISLHPQRQKDYFEKLHEGLKLLGIKKCFFIVVTHSPLIVLGLKHFKENNYNFDIYGFKQDENGKTISEPIDYISMNSIDEVLGDDFGVYLIDENQKANIQNRYKNLLNELNIKKDENN